MKYSFSKNLTKQIMVVGWLALFTVVPASGWAQSVLQFIYTNNFQSYSTNSYPIPTNPLPGWTGMTSQNGLQPAIVERVGAADNKALNLNSTGGGATGYLSVNSPLLQGTTSAWEVAANTRYVASNNGPNKWYGTGGLLLSSTGDMSGDYLWLTIQSGWGEVDATTTWARPTLDWRLAGTSGGGVLLPWAPPAGVTNLVGNAMRMSTDTGGPAIMGLSRTGGSSSLAYTISSPVDGPFSGSLAFTGAQVAALDNLQYVGFANYLSNWQYDDLSVKGLSTATALAIPEPSSLTLLGLAGFGLLLHRRRRQA